MNASLPLISLLLRKVHLPTRETANAAVSAQRADTIRAALQRVLRLDVDATFAGFRR